MTRRLISLAVAVVFTLTILPIPLPFAAPSRTQKDTSQPFPCQNRTCGCCSADQCWKKCCCFSNQQKVAWAKKNNVTLPQFVVEAARAESDNDANEQDLANLPADELETEICSLPEDIHSQLAESSSDESAHQSSEQSTKSNSPSSAPQAPRRTAYEWIAGLIGVPPQHRMDNFIAQLVTKASIATREFHDSIAAETDQDSETFSDVRLVLIIKALECRGQGSQWIVCAPVAMPVAVCVSNSSDTPCEFVRNFSERLIAGSRQPPVPPPRIC